MDINDLDTKTAHDAGCEMRVVGPNGLDTDVYITLVGVDSAKWKGIRLDIERDSLKGNEAKEAADFIADATIGWRGIVRDGEDIPFSRDEALKLYILAPYICTQADKFIARRLNFLTPSQKI